MCKICNGYKCLPFCPEYRGDSAERGRALGACSICGTYIYGGDGSRARGKRLYCVQCAGR